MAGDSIILMQSKVPDNKIIFFETQTWNRKIPST